MQSWDGTLWLFSPEEFDRLPDGFEVKDIMGETAIKGKDYIDRDTRGGWLAYGVDNPKTHPQAELLTKIILQGT